MKPPVFTLPTGTTIIQDAARLLFIFDSEKDADAFLLWCKWADSQTEPITLQLTPQKPGGPVN